MNCCVCNRSINNISEHKSLNEKTLPYCFDCWTSYRESYSELVDFGWEFEAFAKTYQQKTLKPSLQFNNKTIEQFNEDIRKKERV